MSNRIGPNYMSRADRAERRNRVLELFEAGNRPSQIAAFMDLTKDHVCQMIHDAGMRPPNYSADDERTHSMWDMDEDARRKAIILRAATGARKTLLGDIASEFPRFPQ